jgi:hypothetical protein
MGRETGIRRSERVAGNIGDRAYKQETGGNEEKDFGGRIPLFYLFFL